MITPEPHDQRRDRSDEGDPELLTRLVGLALDLRGTPEEGEGDRADLDAETFRGQGVGHLVQQDREVEKDDERERRDVLQTPQPRARLVDSRGQGDGEEDGDEDPGGADVHVDTDQRADTDGNHKTQPASWTHLVTGNHPEYPSGHGCETGALTEALQRFFHTDRVYLEIESAIFPAPDPRHTRSYDRLGDLYDEVINARIWGGLHFRSTMEETYKLPNRVVAHVAAHHFRETRGKD